MLKADYHKIAGFYDKGRTLTEANMKRFRDDVEHRMFPETLEIDIPRTPTRGGVEDWLRDAGYVDIETEVFHQQTYPTAQAHLEAVRSKSTSVLSMISDEAFAAGIARLEQYVEEEPDDEWLLYDWMTWTSGNKRSV